MTQPYIPPIMNDPKLADAIAKDRDLVVDNLGDSPYDAAGLGVGPNGERTLILKPKPPSEPTE